MHIPIVVYIYMSFALLSFIGSTVIIILIIKSRGKKISSQQLLIRMASFDAVYSMVQFIVIYPDDRTLKIRCAISAFFEQSSSMGVFISCFLLSYCSYKSISQSQNDIENFTRKSLIYTLTFSIILALIPIIKFQTQSSQYTCLFAGIFYGDGDIEVLIIFYLPLLIFLSGSLLFDILSLKHVRKLKKINGERVVIQAAEEILQNMFMYPIIFAFCWSGYIIYRISGLFCSTCANYINIESVISINNLQGFFNSIVYVYNIWKAKKIISHNILQQQISGSTYKDSKNSSLTEYILASLSVNVINTTQQSIKQSTTELQDQSTQSTNFINQETETNNLIPNIINS